MDFDKPTLKRLQKLFSQPSRTIHWYYQAGKLVSRLTPKPKPHEPKRYRVGITPLARELLGETAEHSRRRQCENQLYRARHYYDSFDWSELQPLGNLSQSSAELLLRVRSKVQRKKLADSCIKNKWAIRELQREVASANGRKFSQASHPFKDIEFHDAASALRDVSSLAKQWLHHDRCWFGPDTKLTDAHLQRLSGSEADCLRDAYKKLGEVVRKVQKAQAVMKSYCDA